MTPKYEIITDRRVYDEHYCNDSECDTWADELVKEQDAKLADLGIKNDAHKFYPIHFFDDDSMVNDTIYDAIQCLAIKDGVDLVKYNNGNYGFVSYYNGLKDGFEIYKDDVLIVDGIEWILVKVAPEDLNEAWECAQKAEDDRYDCYDLTLFEVFEKYFQKPCEIIKSSYEQGDSL